MACSGLTTSMGNASTEKICPNNNFFLNRMRSNCFWRCLARLWWFRSYKSWTDWTTAGCTRLTRSWDLRRGWSLCSLDPLFLALVSGPAVRDYRVPCYFVKAFRFDLAASQLVLADHCFLVRSLRLFVAPVRPAVVSLFGQPFLAWCKWLYAW